ncbi:hypothetical protein HJC23_008562 [Cyclotella cryptica]|uniref:AB hydrolase-1 domain-containing protein n=1 Tax=Cyclotella cryptica TaxID=29204 RepID=A0ABD3PLQ7_9STRA|eukprot:CCRYP_013221-RA/>CCRYP_013221-RA protein AED:0.03 eAED:0.03 QI:114/1/1/1/1/1/2/342/365
MMPGLSIIRKITAPSSTRSAQVVTSHRVRSCEIVTTTASRRAISSATQDAKLSYEWLVDGQVVPSDRNHEVHERYADREVIVFLHGLLGNAKNLRTPAKKLTERLPHLSALCLDIRGHGNSNNNSSNGSSSTKFCPPHNFQSCTHDIFHTLQPLGLVNDRSPVAICGHSLGGRIALQYSYELITRQSPSLAEATIGISPPKQTWILDSVPGRVHPSVHNVINVISSIPLPIPSKSGLTSALMEEHGFDKGAALWMASNLQPTDGGFDWIFDLSIAKELISNFTNQEFHSMIEHVVAGPEREVHLVMAGKNAEWTTDIVNCLKRIQSLQSRGEKFHMHTLEKAGHWVHVDDLEGLLELMVESLSRR